MRTTAEPAVEGERPPAPRVSSARLAAAVERLYGLTGRWSALASSIDQNALLRTADGSGYVVKVVNQADDEDALALQDHVLATLHARLPGAAPAPVPSIAGRARERVEDEAGRVYALRVVGYVEGPLLAEALRAGEVRPQTWRSLGELLARVDAALADTRHPADGRRLRWDLAHASWILAHAGVHADPQRRGLVERVALQFRAHVEPLLPLLPRGLVHGDGNEANVVVAPGPDGHTRARAVIDVGDTVRTARVFELAVAGAYALLAPTEGGGGPEGLATLAAGYASVLALEDAELEVAWPAALMRLAVSVTVAALDVQVDPDNEYLQESQAAAWAALELYADDGPGDRLAWLRARLGRAPSEAVPPAREELLARRARHLGRGLSLSYRAPLVMLRGRGTYLFDEHGRAYLDCVNNVCHVGHCHPHVVAALARQAAELNTNTRYLHPEVLRYAERLTALLPAPLEVCYFVNSGSEANELALRLARAATGRQDVVVLEAGYHGHTGGLIDVSHYKHAGPGGRGTPPWVHVAPLPDGHRGIHRGHDEATGRAYADEVGAALARAAARGPGAAALLAEPIVGCGGQVVPPPGFLRGAYAHARAAGAVCIADEVQVGFGRVGSHWWAFELDGAVPDIVTLGKPIGNGHPLAAVVTTRAIAEAFDDGMEFFSTFGGNPVSAAVGNAVLDVLEVEDLRTNAAARGRELVEGFRALARRHPRIADVRGVGLYLGVAVRGGAGGAALLADAVEAARAEGVLLSIDGPEHDVLKLKPPLVFGSDDVRLLLGVFERSLRAAEALHGLA